MLPRDLIVRLKFNSTSGVPPDEILSQFVVQPDDEGEGHGHQPPLPLKRVHPQRGVHAGAVGQEGG